MTSTTMDAGNYAHGGYKVAIVASILILMQTLMVGGRLLSRRLQKVWLGIDDYILISAAVSSYYIYRTSRTQLIALRYSQSPSAPLQSRCPVSVASAIPPFSISPTAKPSGKPQSHG